jgi:NADH:ubiquinone oxidoreductase subunit D
MKKARSEKTMNNRKVNALKNRNEVKEQLTEAIRNLRDASARVDEVFASLRILRNIRKTVAGMSGEKASECPIGGCVLKFSGACRLGIVPKECPLKRKRAV